MEDQLEACGENRILSLRVLDQVGKRLRMASKTRFELYLSQPSQSVLGDSEMGVLPLQGVPLLRVREPLALALLFFAQQAIMFGRYWFRVATWASEWSLIETRN